MKKTFVEKLSFETLEPRHFLAANPIITEFMASNDGALLDGYGAEQDWIEIFNAGDEPVDLAGYGLTDDPDEKDKWQFPSRILAPGQYLVVYASSRDEVDPAGHLHTNFGLIASGEYLALVSPQGVLLSEFGTEEEDYPEQGSNSAYGLAFNSTSQDVVTPSSASKYWVPTDVSVDSSWMQPTFDDSAWTTGSSSIGHDNSGVGYHPLIQTSLPNQPTSVYVRIAFEVSDPESVLSTLRMKYDDGFVAYLNGTEIVRRFAPEIITYQSEATAFHPREAATVDEVLNISQSSHLLQQGNNVLAIHLMNSPDSPTVDLLVIPALSISSGTLISPTAQGGMIVPTPGAPNTNINASPVEFSQSGGAFIGSVSLALATNEPSELIRYTTDGSVPTTTSTLYAGPLVITSTTQIRARSFGPNGEVGEVRTEAFTLVAASMETFTSDLPIIVIENFGKGIPGREFQDAMIAVYEVDELTGLSSLADEPELTSHIGQHRRGNSTYNQAKYNLRVEFRDEEGDDRGVELLGMPEDSDWILNAPYGFDRSLIRNAVFFDLNREFTDYAIRFRFVEVFANTTDGLIGSTDYMGVYVLMENVKIDENRIPLDELTPADNEAPEIEGGFIIKVDHEVTEEDGGWATPVGTNGSAKLIHVDPNRADLTQQQVDYLRGYVSDFENALIGPNWLDPEIGYAAYLDVDAYIDHHLLRTFSREDDMLVFSEHYYLPRGGKLTMGPGWDFDNSSGSEGNSHGGIYTGWTQQSNRPWRNGWANQLFSDPDFIQKWVDRWQELRNTTYSDENLIATVQRQIEQLETAHLRNAARWPTQAPDGGIYADPELSGYEAEISHLKNWLLLRAQWMDQRMVAKPTIAIEEGENVGESLVTLSHPGGTIYYTLDGSDPRADGGGIAPSAILYDGQFTVAAGSEIIARTFSTPGQTFPFVGTWSGASSEQIAALDPMKLRIVELMYNPPGSGDDTEYFELLNFGTTVIQLEGVRIAGFSEGGFTFSAGTLQPGERVVVVKNLNDFEEDYPDVINIAQGEFSGSLANEGELVTLSDPLGELLQSFVYGDSNVEGWPELPDGDGYSLEYIGPLDGTEEPTLGSPHDPFDNSANWRASLSNGGSPGSDGEPEIPSLADFNGDGRIDGRDFLAWQRGFDKPNAAKIDGDADNDQDVDSIDLQIWQEQYGTVVPEGQESIRDEQEAAIPPASWITSLTLQEAKTPTSTLLVADHSLPSIDTTDSAFAQLAAIDVVRSWVSGGIRNREFDDDQDATEWTDAFAELSLDAWL